MTEWGSIEAFASKNGKLEGKADYYFALTVLGIMGILFMMITSWIFIQAALMLIVRFAALIIALITSPLGIAGINIPFLDHFAGRWWTLLASQAVFAPVFIFLVAVGLNVIDKLAEVLKTGDKTFTGAVSTQVGTHEIGAGILTEHLPLFIVYFIGIVFIYLALQFSKQMAQSVPELKSVYDMADKWATGVWLTPVRLPQRMLYKPIIAPVLSQGLERIAAQAPPGSIRETLFRGLAIGTRSLADLGQKKKEGEKSAGDKSTESISDLRKNRGGDESVLLPWRKRSIFSPWRRERGGKALVDTPKGQRTTQEEKTVQHELQQIKPEDIPNHLTPEQVKNNFHLLNEEQKRWVMSSNAYTAKERKQFVAGISEGVDKARTQLTEAKAAQARATTPEEKERAGAAVAAASTTLADAYDNLSDIDKEILRTNREDLKTDKEFLAALRSDGYQDFRKGGTAEQKNVIDGLRDNHLKVELQSGDRSQKSRSLGNSRNRHRRPARHRAGHPHRKHPRLTKRATNHDGHRERGQTARSNHHNQ